VGPWLTISLGPAAVSLGADWIPLLLTDFVSKPLSYEIGARLPDFYSFALWLSLNWIVFFVRAAASLHWRVLWLIIGLPCVFNAVIFCNLDY
jgi:hypothetical protein